MDADPEEWLEVKEQCLQKQRVLASHQQFGGTLRKIVLRRGHPVPMWPLTCKGLLIGTECQLLSY
jgi:hypothetical protein